MFTLKVLINILRWWLFVFSSPLQCYLRVSFIIFYFLGQMKQDSLIRVLRITGGNIAEAQCDQSGWKSNPQTTKGKTAPVLELQKELVCTRHIKQLHLNF